MRIHIQILVISIVTFCFTQFAFAQEFTGSNYYYNNFNGGALGSRFVKVGANSALAVTKQSADNNLTVNEGYALSATGNGLAGGLQTSFYTNSNLNNEQFGNEWTLIYRNSGGNADDSEVISNGENAWKYWLYSTTSDLNDMKGYYLTQIGSTLYLKYYQDQYNKGTVLQYNVSNNVTYAIRIQRLKRDNGKWMMFVDAYSAAKKEATTLVATQVDSRMNQYVTGGLFASSTTEGRFKFDEIKSYGIQLRISGANSIDNGISSPLYPGQAKAVIYGLQVDVRGLMDLSQIVITTNGVDITNVFNGDIYLNKSTDSYFGNSDDVKEIATMNYWSNTIQKTGGLNLSFNSVGQDNGDMVAAAYYYLTANVKETPLAGKYRFSGTPTLWSQEYNINYAGGNNNNTVVDVQTGNNAAGKLKDWVGNVSSDWDTPKNWSPNGVPGDSDLARIGVTTFTNQPVLTGDATVGNISFGTAKVATLTVNSGVLTVVSAVDNVAGITLAGTGKLEVKGRFVNAPNAAISVASSIHELEVNNLIFSSQNAAITFAKNGNSLILNNIFSTAGSKLNQFLLNGGATLIVKAVTPFSLEGNFDISLVNGAVKYQSEVLQNVSTALSYGNVDFSGSGTKKVAAGVLNVSGDWISTGGKIDLIANRTQVLFDKATAQSITDLGSAAGSGLDFYRVTFTGGGTKSLSSTGKFAVVPHGSLSMGANTILQTADNLTFKASADGFGVTDMIPSSSSIRGKVTAEKYVQGGDKAMWRTYRMLSSPVYDNTNDFISADVPGNRTYRFSQFIDDVIITGTGGAANGFDATAANSAGAWTYNNKFVAIPNINTALNVGQGAYLFYRGDRTNFAAKVVSPFVDPESTIVTFKGVLTQQDVTIPLTHGSTGFSLVGNPYQSVLDWNNVVKTGNVQAYIRIWNPSNRQYALYNGLDGVNGGSRYIQPGQSFFVSTSNNNQPSITFRESSKAPLAVMPTANTLTVAAVNSNNSFKMRAGTVMSTGNIVMAAQPTKVRIKVTNNSTENSDEALVVFTGNDDAAFAGYDILRDGGEGVFLSSRSSDNKELAINYMPSVEKVTVVPLTLKSTADHQYTFAISLTDVPVGYQIKLRDNHTNSILELAAAGSQYAFEVSNAVPSSIGASRFELLLSPVETLPVVFSSFNATKNNTGVAVKWTTATEQNNSHFIVERAGDDKVYTVLGQVAANSDQKYFLQDQSPLVGHNYYRLVQVDLNGTLVTSAPVAVKYDLTNISTALVGFPTFVRTDFTVLYQGSLVDKTYIIRTVDASGRLISNEKISQAELTQGYKANLTALTSGTYFVEVLGVAGGKKVGALKFVKI